MKTWITIELDEEDQKDSDRKFDAKETIIQEDISYWMNQMRVGRQVSYKVTNHKRVFRR